MPKKRRRKRTAEQKKVARPRPTAPDLRQPAARVRPRDAPARRGYLLTMNGELLWSSPNRPNATANVR